MICQARQWGRPAMPTIPCPSRRCHEAHEVRTEKNGRSFVSCEASRNKFFANSPASEAYFGNNGGATRSNPVGNRDTRGGPSSLRVEVLSLMGTKSSMWTTTYDESENGESGDEEGRAGLDGQRIPSPGSGLHRRDRGCHAGQ